MNNPIFLLILVIFIFLIFIYYFSNEYITVKKVTLNFRSLPDFFNGYKILQISDLHSKMFGKGQKKIIDIISSNNPDIIVITGDVIDSRNYRENEALELVRSSVSLAPVYFVAGNHEMRSHRFSKFSEELEALGCNVLRNSNKKIQRNNDYIYIAGVDDVAKYNIKTIKSIYSNQLSKASKDINNKDFCILLAHRPELFDIYAEKGFDLTLSGHTHGGQIRIPFVGGIFVPNQGFFPKYIDGVYKKDASAMFISKGLGSSLFPSRMFNNPEIAIITLNK
jgi:predicted MPP superfamily phosphohydrolase